MSEVPSLFADRTVLVTGGTGSIGSAIVEAVLAESPRALRVVSRDDTKQFDLAQRHRDIPALRMLIGDVRSRPRMTRAMAGVRGTTGIAARIASTNSPRRARRGAESARQHPWTSSPALITERANSTSP